MRTIPALSVLALALLALSLAPDANAAIDPAAAKRAFGELDRMCARDAKALWGVSLCGPTMFVDPATREIAANGADPQKQFTAHDGIWSGRLADSYGIANTSLDFEGTTWTMVMWPLPEATFDRDALLAHESFHRMQEKLGFPSTDPSNSQLDTFEGRYLLQLEWRSLSAALSSLGNKDRASETKQAISDAVLFRARRRAIYPQAATQERALEMHEGLAEYTGTALAAPSLADRVPHLVTKLQDAEAGPSFVRSFAYASGPAWGALLEAHDRAWTHQLHATDDLGTLASRAFGLDPSAPVTAELVKTRADAYHGPEIFAAERARVERQREKISEFSARYVEGAILTLPLTNMKMQFNPNTVQPFESISCGSGDPAGDSCGKVYQEITVSDDWGKIVVTGGALLSDDYKQLIVPAPSSPLERVHGDGWTLSLNPGWHFQRGLRDEDAVIVKEK